MSQPEEWIVFQCINMIERSLHLVTKMSPLVLSFERVARGMCAIRIGSISTYSQTSVKESRMSPLAENH